MDGDTLLDLKKFITTTISQQTAKFKERFDKIDRQLDRIYKRFESIESKVDDLSGSVAEALENVNQATDTQLKDHDQRIVKLEQNTA